jgi:hypothetical protein
MRAHERRVIGRRLKECERRIRSLRYRLGLLHPFEKTRARGMRAEVAKLEREVDRILDRLWEC